MMPTYSSTVFSKQHHLPMDQLVEKICRWAEQFTHFTLFFPNEMAYLHGTFPQWAAIGAEEIIPFTGKDDFHILDNTLAQHPGLWVGHFSYDLKNQLENLSSTHSDTIGFEEISFYRPKFLLEYSADKLILSGMDASYALLDEILNTPIPSASHSQIPALKPVFSKGEYFEAFHRLHQHIVEGDIYEVNLCQEFMAEGATIDPVGVFLSLMHLSPAPFAALHKTGDTWLICASPERFLKKTGEKLISQPIKGTARRHADPLQDQHIKEWLRTNEKERAENMMIVDLVRNDLARSALPGTVKVEELFGIYSFPQVHQMISTVEAQLEPGTSPVVALACAFPMGSMTGAPKIKAMELIEQYEKSRRGLFSGSVGYFDASGNFDFNVVIRSIFYNQTTQHLSFQVGSAITYDAQPEQEYEECMLKAQAMLQALKLGLTPE
jgi:para-aminobenzoate synthetase component I